MSRGGNIALSIAMWCAIAAYVVAASRHAGERRAAVKVRGVAVEITDTTSARVVTERKVASWLAAEGVKPVGQLARAIDTRQIARALATHPEVREASAWCDMEGRLRVKVEPRRPVLRVRTEGGYRFWFTDDGYILPDRGDGAAPVAVVTGRVAFPFPPGASGSYRALETAAWGDYLERYTALADERRSLAARMAATSAAIRAARASSPGRWWSSERKRLFAEARKTRMAELEEERARLSRDVAAVDGEEALLRKKEKKSRQSFFFLSKLAKFVEFIEHDSFWKAQIVQINALGSGTDAEWREPQLELVPRAGSHTILLGGLDGTQARRMENLRLFYLDAAWHEGWDAYDYIDIKYLNQIVCTR